MSRIAGADSGTSPNQGEGGGANPTAMLFHKEDWWVANLSLRAARQMVEQWHYAKGGSNTSVYCHGLYPRDWFWESQSVGCAWWLPPTKSAAMSFDRNWNGVLALSRLVVSPDVVNNAESFLIRHSMRQIDRARWPVLVTYADEWQGHLGVIYEAARWKYAGKTKPEARYVLNGKMVSRKAGPKTRTHAEMLEMGAEYIGKFCCHRYVHRREYDRIQRHQSDRRIDA